ncbi:MAG: hypothetical protein HC894_31210, partial [Microcoleus sp. SM1_3_4]|nr:hypothetical protein [Microcoleus sp. SM1_3_4]
STNPSVLLDIFTYVRNLCSQLAAIFISGIGRFARSEWTVHCEHPGEPQLNTCGFVFSIFLPSNNLSNNLSNKKYRRKQQ